jgi:hypothetical protein
MLMIFPGFWKEQSLEVIKRKIYNSELTFLEGERRSHGDFRFGFLVYAMGLLGLFERRDTSL